MFTSEHQINGITTTINLTHHIPLSRASLSLEGDPAERDEPCIASATEASYAAAVESDTYLYLLLHNQETINFAVVHPIHSIDETSKCLFSN